MSGPRKIRDSQKMVHFLRSELQNSILNTSSSQRAKQQKASGNSSQKIPFSVKNSTHFASYYLKSKDGEYERSLLDVEDLDKVYQVVRENLQVPRPEIPVENNDATREFEEKVKNDVEYREKVLKEQRQARVLIETRRRKVEVSAQSTKRDSKDVTNTSFTSRGGNEQGDLSALKEIEEKNLKNIDLVKGRKKVGKYDVEVDRQVGHKISYHVYAILEKPPKPKKKEVKAIDQKESVFKLLKDDSLVEVIKSSKQEEESPFLKVLVKEHDAFKRESHYVPLRDEEIDIEARMKKKWNAPEVSNFSGSKVRRSFVAPSLVLSEVIGECDAKLKVTKANNSVKSDTNKQFVETFSNLSGVREYRNSVLDREYGISLRHSSLVTPKVRLPTLEEKVEERNSLFGKSGEGGKVRPKNIKVELEKYFDSYQKTSSRAWRTQRNSHRQSMVSRSFQRSSQMRYHREDEEELSERRQTNKLHEQKTLDPYSTYRTSDTHSEIIKRKGSALEPPASLTDKRDTIFAQAFLTQSNFGDKELVGEDHKSARPEPSEMHQTHRTQSSNPRESVYNPLVNNEEQKSKMEISLSYDLGDANTLQKGFWTMKGPRATRISSLLVDGILEKENDGTLDFQNTSKSSSRYRPNRTNTRHSELSGSVNKRGSSMTPCEQIEERLNKSFNEFMSVRARADSKFKTVVNILEKDRPIFNKIRHNKYDASKMIKNNIEELRKDAENSRLERYQESKEQRTLYLSLLDFIVNQEHHPIKLKACYYFMNVFKELLDRGDKLSKEKLNQLLNKMDDENSITKVFIGSLEKVVSLLEIKAEDIENGVIREHLQKHIEEINRKRRYQRN